MHKFNWLLAALLLTQGACSSDSKPAAGSGSAAPAQPSSAADIRQELAHMLPAAQEFTIRPDRDTVLRGAQGTEVHYSAGSLVVPKGRSLVQLTLREFYSPADMVLANLATRSGRRLLETGGMVQLEATAAGQPIKLRQGATVRLRLPTQRVEAGMQLFEGKQDPKGEVDWQLAPKRPASGAPAPSNVDTIRYEMPSDGDPQVEYTEAEAARERRRQLASRNVAGNKSTAQTAFYELELADLGWINCDRFWYTKQPLITVGLPVDTATTEAYLVFKAIRSVLDADSVSGGRIFFSQVPKGAPVTVVALRKLDGQLQLATQAVTLQPRLSNAALTFRPVTAGQLRVALQELK